MPRLRFSRTNRYMVAWKRPCGSAGGSLFFVLLRFWAGRDLRQRYEPQTRLGYQLYRSMRLSLMGVILCEACRLSPLHRNRGMAPTPVDRRIYCKLQAVSHATSTVTVAFSSSNHYLWRARERLYLNTTRYRSMRLSPLHRNRGMAPTAVGRLASTVNCKLYAMLRVR